MSIAVTQLGASEPSVERSAKLSSSAVRLFSSMIGELEREANALDKARAIELQITASKSAPDRSAQRVERSVEEPSSSNPGRDSVASGSASLLSGESKGLAAGEQAGSLAKLPIEVSSVFSARVPKVEAETGQRSPDYPTRTRATPDGTAAVTSKFATSQSTAVSTAAILARDSVSPVALQTQPQSSDDVVEVTHRSSAARLLPDASGSLAVILAASTRSGVVVAVRLPGVSADESVELDRRLPAALSAHGLMKYSAWINGAPLGGLPNSGVNDGNR